MFKLHLSEFTQAEFLRDYWQKKPVVIRQGFQHFEDPISADELAGLACEEEVESRLIYKENDQWQAKFGPFESYDHLGEKDWSLVVQALDNWSEEAAQIIEAFRFIPHWRLDDLMASFAVPGGSVGPHIDLYDTFICQGSGKRHWRVGGQGDHQQFSAHEALLHVQAFDAIIDVELLPGDILYIPPGHPHEGKALETSLSFSVGFRTNSTVNLVSGLADYLIDNELGDELIEDAERSGVENSGAINNDDFHLLKNHLTKLLENDDFIRQFTGVYLTQAKHELALVESEEAFEPEDVSEILAENKLMRLGGLRAFYFTESVDKGLCYIDGVEHKFAPEITEVVKLLCDNVTITTEKMSKWRNNDDFLNFICPLLNTGYWYFST
jgi:50S ribosomal protein L16 3-hydroxylase